jgi:hypothetical protein
MCLSLKWPCFRRIFFEIIVSFLQFANDRRQRTLFICTIIYSDNLSGQTISVQKVKLTDKILLPQQQVVGVILVSFSQLSTQLQQNGSFATLFGWFLLFFPNSGLLQQYISSTFITSFSASQSAVGIGALLFVATLETVPTLPDEHA